MKGKRFLSLLLCLAMLLGCIPAFAISAYADDTTWTANDTYQLNISGYSESNGKPWPTTYELDEEKSTLTIKYWDDDAEKVKTADKITLGNFGGVAGNTAIIKDASFEISMTLYPAAGKAFAASNALRVYTDDGNLNLQECKNCNVTETKNADGSRTYKYKYTEALGAELAARGGTPTLYFLFTCEDGSNEPVWTAADTYTLSIQGYSAPDGVATPTTHNLDKAKSTLTVKYWSKKAGAVKEETVSLTSFTKVTDRKNKLIKDPNFEVSLTIYPSEGFKFADSDALRIYTGNGTISGLQACTNCNITETKNSDGSRTYKFKYTEALGTELTAQGGTLYFLFSCEEGSSEPTWTSSDTYQLNISGYSETGGKVVPVGYKLDADKSTLKIKYWDRRNKKAAEANIKLSEFGGDNKNTKIIKDKNFEISMTVFPAEGYKLADNAALRVYTDDGYLNLQECTSCNVTETKNVADGSRTYTYKYTEALGKELTGRGGVPTLYFLFTCEEGSNEPVWTAADTYTLSIQGYSAPDGVATPTKHNLDKDKSTLTVKYWSKAGAVKEETVSLTSFTKVTDRKNKLIKDTNFEVSLTIYPSEGFKFADSDALRIYTGDGTISSLQACANCNITETKNSDGSRTYKFKYTEALGTELTARGGTLYFLFSCEKAQMYTVTYILNPNGRDKITLQAAEGTQAPEPTEEQLLACNEYLFSNVTVKNWYSKAPKDEGAGKYTYSSKYKLDQLPVVTGNMTLYAENAMKPDGKILVGFYLPVRNKVTSKTGLNSSVKIYNMNAKTLMDTGASNADKMKQMFLIPVGSPIEASVVPSTGKYSALLAESESGAVLKRDADVEGWYYANGSGGWPEYKKGTTIPADIALRTIQNTDPWLIVYPKVTFHCTVTFHTNASDVKIPNYEFDSVHEIYHYQGVRIPAETQTSIDSKIAASTNGNVFAGWYLTENCTEASKTTLDMYLAGDVDLYAKWVDPCTITYDLKNGEADITVENADAYKQYTVGIGDHLTAPERPVASGNQKGKLAFMGWYKDEKREAPWNFTDTVSESVTLHAKWIEATPLTIQFKKYDPDDLGKLEGVRSVTVPVAAGYTFGTLPDLPNSAEGEYVVGQDRDIKYTGWKFRSGDAETILTSDMDLSAYSLDTTKTLEVYTAYGTRFTFTFNTGEGEPTPDSQVITAANGKAASKAKRPTTDPSRAGYDFVNWYADSAGNTAFDFTKEYDENTTIYAKWESQPEYTVTFDLTNTPGASVELRKQKADGTSSKIAQSSTTETTVTYKLKRGSYSYTCSANGYLSQTRALTIDSLSETQINIPVTLVAFVPVTKVSLKTNQVMKNKAHNLDTLAVITPDNATSRTIMWALAGTYSGVTLDDNLLKIDAGCAETQVTLTATVEGGKLSEDGTSQEAFVQENIKLSIIPYVPTISFRNGKTAPSVLTKPLPEDMQTNSDGKLTLTTSNNPEATGYDFAGWYLDEDCTEAQKWDAAHVFETDSILYAKWVKKTVEITVTFSDGGSQTKTETHNAGETLILPPIMFTKAGHIFAAWELPNKTTQTAGSSIAALPENDVTYTATWTAIGNSITKGDIENSILGITDKNAADHKQQLLAARDALMTGTATKTDAALINKLSNLFVKAGLGSVTIAGDAKQGVSEVGAILSSDGAAVVLNVNKLATPGKTLPEAYQNAEYKSAWYSLSMTVGGATTEPKAPVILTMPIPAALSEMAADTIRVLLYKGAATEPVVMTPTVSGSNLTFAYDGNGQLAFVGKSISDAADTRVTALEMRYNGTKMGNVEQDANGNFTVTLPSTTSESVLQDLASGINSKWVTYMTVAPKATVKPSDGGAQNAEYWAKTGLTLTYSLTNSNKYSDSKTFTVTAENGTTRNFTVTVKKITDADRNYKIAVSNINGGTVTATPSPAAAGEEVKLTVTPNDGKKLVAGTLSYCLQSAGAKSVPIDESSLTFIMPAGDININAQFEDDANAPLKNPPQITAFVVNGVSAVINSDTKAITIILPYGTDLRHVAPTIVTANASKVKPSSAQRVDLSTPKAYRVYASNGAYVTYTVTAYTEEPSPTQSLWEKLQNQINSSPNWWELAEYQKKTGYYR